MGLTHCTYSQMHCRRYLISTLVHLVCVLPYNNQRFAPQHVTSDMIQQLNQENQEWVELQSKKQCIERCSEYYEELISLRWHPDRVEHLIQSR
jgi:hypothetical protein